VDSHSARYREIARVLAQFGFDSVVDTAGFGRWTGRRVPRREPEVRSIARRLTLALGELGPTFVKLGQALSTRPDVIPKVFVDE
jgi:ubiquinone biosynthesis protein